MFKKIIALILILALPLPVYAETPTEAQALVDATIKPNGVNAITGSVLNAALTAIINAIGYLTTSQGVYPIVNYGAVCDNLTDNTTAIRAAVTDAQNNGGGTILLPAGTCLVNGEINNNLATLHFLGAGKNVTFLKASIGTINVLSFSGSAFDSSVADLTIDYGQVDTPTAGCGIATSNGVGRINISNVRVQNLYRGICSSNPVVTGVVALQSVDISNIINDSILIGGISQLIMSDVTSFQSFANEACIHLRDAAGFYFTNVTCGGSISGLLIDPTAGQNVFDGFVVNMEVDNSQTGGSGFNIDSSGGGKIWNIMMTNTRAGFGGGNGYAFNGANTSNVTISNCRAERNVQNGMLILNIQSSSIAQCQFLGNSVLNNSYSGLVLTQGANLSISDIRATAVYPNESNSGQNIGIDIQSSYSGVAAIRDSNLIGNSVALNNSSTSTGVTIQNVIGYNPIGVVYPTLGASPWTYTAGVSPELIVLNNGTCINFTVGGVAVPTSAGNLISFFLAPHQALVGTCTVNPGISALKQ